MSVSLSSKAGSVDTLNGPVSVSVYVRDRVAWLGQPEPVGVHDLELVEGGLPDVAVAAASSSSAVGASDLSAAEVEQFDEGFVVGEVAARLGDLAELVVDALDHVRGVEHLADVGREREERDDLFPRGPPGFLD